MEFDCNWLGPKVMVSIAGRAKKGLISRGLPRNNKGFFGSIPCALGSRLLIDKCTLMNKKIYLQYISWILGISLGHKNGVK
ncbi:MAG: hypothetical protein CR994_01265 [Maribacter sp.]|nr:MAG: hypothetical protein CR994_01265 [Maribacter sp.]